MQAPCSYMFPWQQVATNQSTRVLQFRSRTCVNLHMLFYSLAMHRFLIILCGVITCFIMALFIVRMFTYYIDITRMLRVYILQKLNILRSADVDTGKQCGESFLLAVHINITNIWSITNHHLEQARHFSRKHSIHVHHRPVYFSAQFIFFFCRLGVKLYFVSQQYTL